MELLQRIRAVEEELKAAEERLNFATNQVDIDLAVIDIDAAERKRNLLYKLAKKEGVVANGF